MSRIIEFVLQTGLNFIVFIQQYRTPILDSFFKCITSLGEEEFYFASLPLLLWSLEYSVAVRLVGFVLLSHYCNIFIKELVREPRPFLSNPAVQLIAVGGYSFPSNHAQTGLVFWLGLGLVSAQKWLYILLAALSILIGSSRIYLGVHYPSDVLIGWLIGSILLVLFYQSISAPNRALFRGNWLNHSLLALLIPGLLLIMSPSHANWAITAALSGGWCGCIFRQLVLKNIPERLSGSWMLLFVRQILGLFTILLLLHGLKSLFPDGYSQSALILRFIRYWLAAFWAVGGVPWLFSKLGLLSQSKQPPIYR
ncbi:membrane protein [Sporomusaceae bacterium FL31]|nr:membrane protein [Sporomusaceae bacterium FL31]GCE32844.1 membrane protein [Sporomusaceae bacterium]